MAPGKVIIRMIIQVIHGAIKGRRRAQERKVIKVIKMIRGEPSLIILAGVRVAAPPAWAVIGP